MVRASRSRTFSLALLRLPDENRLQTAALSAPSKGMAEQGPRTGANRGDSRCCQQRRYPAILGSRGSAGRCPMSSTLQLLGRTVLALLVVVGLPQFAHADLHRPRLADLPDSCGGPPPRRDGGRLRRDVRHAAAWHGLTKLTIPARLGVPSSSRTSADGGSTPVSAFVQAGAATQDTGFGSREIAEASAAITFRPLIPNFHVETMSPFPPFSALTALAQLYDETAGGAVLTIPGRSQRPLCTTSRSI